MADWMDIVRSQPAMGNKSEEVVMSAFNKDGIFSEPRLDMSNALLNATWLVV